MKKSSITILAIIVLIAIVVIIGVYMRYRKSSTTPSLSQQKAQEKITSTAEKVTSTAEEVTTSSLESSKVVNSTKDLSKGYVSLLGNITSISKNSLVLYSKGESLTVNFDPDCHVSKMGDNSQIQRATLQDIHNGDRVSIYCKITKDGKLLAAGIHILSDSSTKNI